MFFSTLFWREHDLQIYIIELSDPEAVVSSKYGRELLLSKTYQENVCAVVVDEAHCIVEWLVLIYDFFMPNTPRI